MLILIGSISMCMYIILIILNLSVFSWVSYFNTYILTHTRTRNILIYYTLLPKHLHTTHHTHIHTHTHTYIYIYAMHVYIWMFPIHLFKLFFCSKCHWFQVSIWKSRNLLWLNANTVFYLYSNLNNKTFYSCNLFRREVS